MANQQKLVRDLQPSESRRFQNVESIDATATKNPLGLRWANIERAFHGAASKIVGWSFDETLKSFLDTPAIDRIVFLPVDTSWVDFRFTANRKRFGSRYCSFWRLLT